MISFITRSIAIVVVGGIADLIGLENMYLVCAVIGLMSLPFLFKLKDSPHK